MRHLLLTLVLTTGLCPAVLAATPAQVDLARALAADAAGDGDTANARLATLSDDRAARLELGLDLVEAWWRVAHAERAINTLSKWRQEAPRSPDPVVRARARALTGSPFDVDAALETCAEHLCQLLPVAKALDVVGQRDAGQRLLDRALAAGGCADAAAQRARWERPRSPGPAAPKVASPLPERHFVLGPGHEPRFVRVMPEQPGELSDGSGLIHLGVPEDHAEALYGALGASASTCAEAPLCVTLRHPSVARSGDRLVGAFALRAEGAGTLPGEGLLDGISARLRAEGDWDPWQETTRAPARAKAVAPPAPTQASPPPEEAPDRRLWVVAGLLLAMGLIWVGRRRLRRAD